MYRAGRGGGKSAGNPEPPGRIIRLLYSVRRLYKQVHTCINKETLMLWTAVVLFLAAAIGGLLMATRIFRDRKPPMALALGHGAAAAVGLVLVLLVWLAGGAGPLVLTGLAVLALAALGGFYLLSIHLRDRAHPKAVVVAHAVLAVCGVAVLLFGIL